MMDRSVRVAGLAALAGLLAGCITTVPSEIVRAPVAPPPELAPPSLAKLMQSGTRMPAERLEAPASLGIVWLGTRQSTTTAFDAPKLEDFERAELMQRLVHQLSAPPFGPVTALSPALTNPSSPETTLASLRHVAARQGLKVLVLVEAHSLERSESNSLSPLYAIDPTRSIVPGEDIAVHARSEACAVDVASGGILVCAQGHGQARQKHAFPWARQSSAQSLRVEALHDAVAAASNAILDMTYSQAGLEPVELLPVPAALDESAQTEAPGPSSTNAATATSEPSSARP